MDDLIKRVQQLKQDFDPNIGKLFDSEFKERSGSNDFLSIEDVKSIISDIDKNNIYERYENIANEISSLPDDLFKDFSDIALSLGLIEMDSDGWDFTF